MGCCAWAPGPLALPADDSRSAPALHHQSYDEKTEFVIPDNLDAEELAHNLIVRQQLEAGIAAAAKAKKGKGGR